MKIFLNFFLVAGFAALLFGCGKEESSASSESQLRANIVSGNWRVSYCFRDSVEHTSKFTGYAFTFTDAGVLTAVKSPTTNTGSWGSSTVNAVVKVSISFSSPADFLKLNKTDWTVVTNSPTIIRLTAISSNGVASDGIVFEKN